MYVNIKRVIPAAMAGWAGMTGLVFAGQRTGLTRMNIMEIEGALFAEPGSPEARTMGFTAHLGMSLGIGFIYALGFKALGWRPGWTTGARGGLIHWALATIVTGLMSKKHPKRTKLAMPGFGGLALGPRSALGFLVGHVLYGALFGWQYGRKGQG
jgi:hypothetical protein